MMTESWSEENKPTENKYFFSNYQEKEGLLIATKVITGALGGTPGKAVLQVTATATKTTLVKDSFGC
jgi:hypothetical protein